MNAFASDSAASIRRNVPLTPATLGYLRAEGKQIVDENGHYTLLRGANFYGYEFGLWDRHIEQDYQKMSSWGFNVVRLPIAWNFIEPKAGTYDDGYFSQYVDRDIGWAKKYGLYVILDMHEYGWSPYFTYYDSWRTAGLPSWAVSAYPNDAEGAARARADFWNGLGPNGTLASGANPSMQDRFIQMWKHVAARYGNEPVIAAFDLFNEPGVFANGITFYNPNTFCKSTIPDFLTKVVDAIRVVDNRHIIMWEPAENCIWNLTVSLSTITSPVRRPNVVYSLHYPGVGDAMTLSRGYCGDRDRLEKAFENSVLHPSNDWNQPVFIGEYGIEIQAINATQYIRDFVALMNKHFIGGAWWTYGRGSSFGMNLLDQNGSERLALIQNIVVPYVRVSTSSGVSSVFSAESKTFNVDVKGPATMAICLPSYFSLRGVDVDSSAQVVWVPSQRSLSVALPVDASALVVEMQ